MLNVRALAALLLGILSASCSPHPRAVAVSTVPGYDLARADASFDLPAELREISALTDIDDHTVACVQDEHGWVFHIDLRTGAVTRRMLFGEDGDYEGLTRIGDALWVLRSDGLMLQLRAEGERLVVAGQFTLAIGHQNIEGLGYDARHNTILVSPKDVPEGGKVERGRRHVFAVDPATGAQVEGRALTMTLERVLADAARLGIELPMKTNRRGKERSDLKLRFSSIAVHPTTDQIYLLSAVDGALLVVDRQGALHAAHFFAPAQLPKAEGITFLQNGDLVLSSEGGDVPPRVQVFRYRPTPTAGAPAVGK